MSDDLLSTPIDQGSDAELNAELRERGGVNKLTVILAALAVAGVAFAGGIWAHSAFASNDNSSQQGAQNGNNRGFGNRPSGQNRPSNGNGNTGNGFRGAGITVSGTIERIEGTTLILKAANGQEVKVALADDTKILLGAPGKKDDLTSGATVSVQVQANQGQNDGNPQDRTFKAQTITKQP